MDLNTVTIMGRLTRDPELKTLPSEMQVVNFNIAHNVAKEKSIFIDCVAFGRNAEFITKYFKKGGQIILSGSLDIDSYTDKEGKDARKTKIKVSQVFFPGSGKKRETEETPF